MTLVPADDSKDTRKKIKKYGIKSEILLDQQAITHNDYHKKYMKIKFNSDEYLTLEKTLEL